MEQNWEPWNKTTQIQSTNIWPGSQKDKWRKDRLPPGGSDSKASTCNTMQETQVWTLGRKDPLEKGMATCSSILAWRIPWTV